MGHRVKKADICFGNYKLYLFLDFLFRIKDLAILDCRFGFSTPNYIYYQLERSGGEENGEIDLSNILKKYFFLKSRF